MTINNQQIEITYDWDGVPAELPIPFEIYDPIQVKWGVVDNGGSPSNVVAMVEKDADGNWVLNVTGGSAAEIKVWRETPITQEVDYNPYDAFPAESHEGALDKLTMIAQELETKKGDMIWVDENYVSLDGDTMREGNSGIDMAMGKIANLGDPSPTEPQDAVNVKYYHANLIPGIPGDQGVPGPGVEPRPDSWGLPIIPPGEDWNPVFWVNDNELRQDYTVRRESNAGTFGPIDINANVTLEEGATWTVVGKESEGITPTKLAELEDVDVGTSLSDQYALLWVEAEQMWRPALAPIGPKGDSGEDGKDGKSAYDLYLESTDDVPPLSLEEWLDANGGAAGADGKSAYELAVENGFVGTEAEWLDSLNGETGEDGEDGKSAYELAVEGGFVGTEAEWIDSLKGETGVDGKGWTDGQYNPDTGIVTFESDDGLEFTTGDLRGEDGQPGPGFEYKGNVASIGALPGGAEVGDAYFVEDVGELYAWGADGSWSSLGAIQGPEGEAGHGWASGVYDDTTGVVTFTGDSDSGFLTFSTGDLRAPEPDPGVYPDKDYIDNADQALQDQITTNAGNISQNTTDITALEGRVTVNEGDITALDGRVTVNEGDISQNATDIATNETNIAKNAADIEKNKNDISSINAKLTPGSHETILTSVDNGDGTFSTAWAPNDHDGGVLINNTEPWDHGQYNTLTAAVIQNDGTAAPRAMLGDLHLNANQKVSVSAAGICSVFVEEPTVNGVFANLMLDPIAAYTFDVSKFAVPDINEEKWLYVRVVSDGGKWRQVGAHYVGESGGLGSGAEEGVFRSHYNATQEEQTITADRNALSAGPVQLDHLVTIETGAVWAIV